MVRVSRLRNPIPRNMHGHSSPSASTKFSHASRATGVNGIWQCKGVDLASVKEEDSIMRRRVPVSSLTPSSTENAWP